MLSPTEVESYILSINSNHSFVEEDYLPAVAALPDSSLNFLIELCQQLEIKNVFEFGSGRSTKALLKERNISVVSIEDTDFWLQQTIKTLSSDEEINHKSFVNPLRTRLLGAFPVLDWRVTDQLKQHLQKAELVLVDSPYYTPFRESTLWSALTVSEGAVVILDDTRIPTLSKFCDRIVTANKELIHTRVKVGHSFDIFYCQNKSILRLNHSFYDILKGWYRFIQGTRFYAKLNI